MRQTFSHYRLGNSHHIPMPVVGLFQHLVKGDPLRIMLIYRLEVETIQWATFNCCRCLTVLVVASCIGKLT